MKQSQVHWVLVFPLWSKVFPAGEVEMTFSCRLLLLRRQAGKFRTGPPEWGWGWVGIIQLTVSQFQVFFCSGSNARLKHDDVGSFNEVLVFPIDQRVPLIKVLL